MCTQLSAGNDIIKPKNWLLLVSVRILCLNRIRDSRKHATVESLSPLPDKINTSGVSLMMLESAVQALDPDLCEARILRELWGLSYAEIAEILDATVTSQKL